MRTERFGIFRCSERRRESGGREVSLYFQRGERGSACEAEGLRYLWRQLNSQEYMILTGCASRREHVGGRAIRRDRAQADVPRSRPLIFPCSLLYFIREAVSPPSTPLFTSSGCWFLSFPRSFSIRSRRTKYLRWAFWDKERVNILNRIMYHKKWYVEGWRRFVGEKRNWLNFTYNCKLKDFEISMKEIFQIIFEISNVQRLERKGPYIRKYSKYESSKDKKSQFERYFDWNGSGSSWISTFRFASLRRIVGCDISR